MKTFLYLVTIAFFFGCSGAPKPVALENSAKISINQGLLTEYNNEVPKDPLLSGNNWAYNLTARKQSDGELLKNSEVTKMFYFAHNADKIIIIGSKGIAKEYQDYFIENAVTALIEVQPVTDVKLKNDGVNILFFGNGKEKSIMKKAPVVVNQEEPIILHVEEKNTFETQAPLEITEVVTPIESPKVEMSQPKQPIIEEKSKVEEKKLINTPQKSTIKNLALKEQKPLTVVEHNSTIAPQEPQKSTKTPLVMVEDVKPIETPKIDQNASTQARQNENTQTTQAQNTKPVEINATANKSIEAHDTSIATDKNVSVEQKVTAMIEELKSTPLSEAEAALKSSTRVDVTLKSDVNSSKNTNETLTKTDTNNTKLDAKPAIETVAIADRPFDTNTSANAQARSELNLIETIEEALGVYPDINEEKLRADLMREVVKYPHIDAQAVKNMPLKKGLLLQLLKVAKEKQP